jgi:endonuclease/exonuclease/phosphatase family metal-dependent hydrolase
MITLLKGSHVFHTTHIPWRTPNINVLTWFSKTPYYTSKMYPLSYNMTYAPESPACPLLLKKNFNLLEIKYEATMAIFHYLPFLTELLKDFLNSAKCDGFYTTNTCSMDTTEVVYLLLLRDSSDLIGLTENLVYKNEIHVPPKDQVFKLYKKTLIAFIEGFFKALVWIVKIVSRAREYRSSTKRLLKQNYINSNFFHAPSKKPSVLRICTWNVHKFKNVYFQDTRLVCEQELKKLNADVICLQECFIKCAISKRTFDKSNIIESRMTPGKSFTYAKFGSVAVATCLNNIAILSVHLNVSNHRKRFQAIRYFLEVFHTDCPMNTTIILGDMNMVLRKHYSKQRWDTLQKERVHVSEDKTENLLLASNYTDVFGALVDNTCWSGRRVDYVYLKNTNKGLRLSPWISSMRHTSDHLCLGLDISGIS